MEVVPRLGSNIDIPVVKQTPEKLQTNDYNYALTCESADKRKADRKGARTKKKNKKKTNAWPHYSAFMAPSYLFLFC